MRLPSASLSAGSRSLSVDEQVLAAISHLTLTYAGKPLVRFPLSLQIVVMIPFTILRVLTDFHVGALAVV